MICNLCKKEMTFKFSAKQWRSFECMNTKCPEYAKTKIINNSEADDFMSIFEGFKR